MAESKLPSVSSEAKTDRSGIVERLQNSIAASGDKVMSIQAASLSGDPIVAGVSALLSKGIFSSLSRIGGLMPKLGKTKVVDQNGNEHMVTVEGKIEFSSQEIERTVEPIVDNGKDEEKEDENETKESVSKIESALTTLSEKLDTAGNVGAGLTGLFLGNDPIVAAISALAVKTVGSKLSKGAKGLAEGTGAFSEGFRGGARKALQEDEDNKVERIDGEKTKKRGALVGGFLDGIKQAIDEAKNVQGIKNNKVGVVTAEQKADPRERLRQEVKDNRQTKAIRRRMEVADSDVTAAAATAAIAKMDTGDKLEKMEQKVVQIGDYLKDGLPTPKEKAQELLARRKAEKTAKEEKKVLEKIADNTEKEKEQGLLAGLFSGLGEFGRLGVAGAAGGLGGILGGMVGSITRIFTIGLPRLLFAAIKKIPLVGMVVSLFRGMFDGATAFLQGESVLGSIGTAIQSFADSVVSIFSFGLINMQSINDFLAPAFMWVEDTTRSIVEYVSGMVDKVAEAFSTSVAILTSIPDMIRGMVYSAIERIPGGSRLLNFFSDEEESPADRLPEAERNRLSRVLGSSIDLNGEPLSNERREAVENRLRTIDGQSLIAPTPGTSIFDPGPNRQLEMGIEAFEGTAPRIEMLPANQTMSRMERDDAAEAFQDRSISLELEGLREDIRNAGATRNQINSVIQNNSQQSTIMQPRGNLRKDDYFAGSSNREVDFGG